MEHPLIEAATLTVDQQYPHATGELFALLVAHELFNQLRRQTANGPNKPYLMVVHAQRTVGQFIDQLN